MSAMKELKPKRVKPNLCRGKKQINRPIDSGKPRRTYHAFMDQAHGDGVGSLANTPLSMHSEMMAIHSALSLSSVISSQGSARSTQWLQKPCFKLSSRSQRQNRLQQLKLTLIPSVGSKAPNHRPLRSPPASLTFKNRALNRAKQYSNVEYKEDYNNAQHDQQMQPYTKRIQQINSVEFQKAQNAKEASKIRNEKESKEYRQYGRAPYDILHHGPHHHNEHHYQDPIHTASHKQHRHKNPPLVIPQKRILTHSHELSERIKDPRLRGADLYVARLARTSTSRPPGPRKSTIAGEQPSTTESEIPNSRPCTGSLYDELRFPFPKEKACDSTPQVTEQASATHSRPCK